jgi:hypothetical protein
MHQKKLSKSRSFSPLQYASDKYLLLDTTCRASLVCGARLEGSGHLAVVLQLYRGSFLHASLPMNVHSSRSGFSFE